MLVKTMRTYRCSACGVQKDVKTNEDFDYREAGLIPSSWWCCSIGGMSVLLCCACVEKMHRVVEDATNALSPAGLSDATPAGANRGALLKEWYKRRTV